MTPYLPVLSGHKVGGDVATQQFLDDYRKTQGQLLTAAYYRTAVAVAHAAGLGVESEAGGPGPPIHQVPVDALEALGTLDEVRGEFWPRRPDSAAMWVIKETACAAHIYGKQRVHMESFTSTHHWQDGPSDLKPSADRAFCEGANHIVWHTSAHEPPEAGRPGWVYGAGTHLTPNDIWWNHAPRSSTIWPVARSCSSRAGRLPTSATITAIRGTTSCRQSTSTPALGPGFDYDVTNAEILRTRMTVRDGRVEVPDGPSYARCWCCPTVTTSTSTCSKRVEELVQAGATVRLSAAGRRVPVGFTGPAGRDEEVRALADRLWGPVNGRDVTEARRRKGPRRLRSAAP